jgi:hypothetical protein
MLRLQPGIMLLASSPTTSARTCSRLARRASVACCCDSRSGSAYSFSDSRGRRAGGGRQQQQRQRPWSDGDDSAPRRPPPRGSSCSDEQQHPWWQHAHRYLVTCHPGLETVTAADLQSLTQTTGIAAAVEVTAPGRVCMGSDSLAAGYAAAVCLRSATRVLHLVHEQQLDPAQPAGQTVSVGCWWRHAVVPGVQQLGKP